MKHIIHINQHNIKHNKKCSPEERKPVITNKTYKENSYSKGLSIYHQGVKVLEVVYSPDKPLSCGANVWIECDDKIVDIKE